MLSDAIQKVSIKIFGCMSWHSKRGLELDVDLRVTRIQVMSTI